MKTEKMKIETQLSRPERADSSASLIMKLQFLSLSSALCALVICSTFSAPAQTADSPRRADGQRPPAGDNAGRDGGAPFDRPPSFSPGGPGGPGGFGGVREKTKLVKQFDKDGDGRLNAAERKAAREFLQKEGAAGRG